MAVELTMTMQSSPCIERGLAYPQSRPPCLPGATPHHRNPMRTAVSRQEATAESGECTLLLCSSIIPHPPIVHALSYVSVCSGSPTRSVATSATGSTFVSPARISPTRRDLHQSRKYIQQLEAQRLTAQQAVGAVHHDFEKEKRQLAILEQQFRTLQQQEAQLQRANLTFTQTHPTGPLPQLSNPGPLALAQPALHAPAPTYIELQKVQQQLALVAALTEQQRATVVLLEQQVRHVERERDLLTFHANANATASQVNTEAGRETDRQTRCVAVFVCALGIVSLTVAFLHSRPSVSTSAPRWHRSGPLGHRLLLGLPTRRPLGKTALDRRTRKS